MTAATPVDPPAPSLPTPAVAEFPTIIPHAPDGRLPDGLLAVPIWSGQSGAAVKVCVIVTKEVDAVHGRLPVRRDLLDARVHLGCLTDALGVLQFVEVWVQSTDALADATRALSISTGAVTNQTMDDRWHRLFEVAAAGWSGSVIATGFETINPPPTFLDAEKNGAVHPPGWQLCRDDTRVAAAGLPLYSSTLHRYLYQPSGDDRRFVPVTPGAPRNDHTVDYEIILPDRSDLIPFNPAGGLILVRPAGNLRVREINDLLGGKPFDGSIHGKSRHRFGPLKSLAAAAGAFLFPGDPGLPSRAVETFLLKLGLWTGMIDEVARYSAAVGRPLLNLQPNSFAVTLDDGSPHLPALWQTRPMLVDAGDAVPIDLPQGDSNHAFSIPGPRVSTGIYQPAVVSRGPVRGFGQLFLSSAVETESGKIFEGMLTLVDPIRPTLRDVLRVRVPAGGNRVDLFVKLAPDAGSAPSLLRFRSVPDDRSRRYESAVETLVGVPLQEVSFEYYPLLGTACDVYSLVILAVEIFLTAPQSGHHAERVRDLLVLSTRCREVQASGTSLEDRITGIFNDKPDTLKGLGPHLMMAHPVDPKTALRSVTPELWFSFLAALVRLLPGTGKDGLLADFGDTLDDRPTGIYDRLLPDLNRLAQRARSLLLGEWGMNRAVGAIVDEFRRPAKSK